MLRTLAPLAITTAIAATLAQGASATVAQTRGTNADGLRWKAEAQWYLDRPAASYYTPAALTAMGQRLEAEARSYQRSAASYYTPAALRAMGARMNAEAQYYDAESARNGSGLRQAATLAAGAVATAVATLVAVLYLRRRTRFATTVRAES